MLAQYLKDGQEDAHLQCVFAREALVTVAAREWLDCQMNALVSLQVVITVEALNTLVALERTIVQRVRCLLLVAVHRVHAAIVGHHVVVHVVVHAVVQTTDHGHGWHHGIRHWGQR